MASSSSIRHRLVLLLTILLGVLSISATARPCRAFFISTAYSFSVVTPQNPNPYNFVLLKPHRMESLTVFTEFNNPDNTIEIFVDRRLRFGNNNELEILRHQRHHEEQQQYERQKSIYDYPLGLFSSRDFTSLRDRTKDILSVVVALLFGVGCGALAASTIYLVWTLFAHRYDYLQSDQFDSESESKEADDPPRRWAMLPSQLGKVSEFDDNCICLLSRKADACLLTYNFA